MGNEFTFDDLIRSAAGQWRPVAVACLLAAVVAGAVSLSLPKKYTAVTRVIVEPGPANPVRNASPESPLMLSVLGGYDQLIHSDRLFADVAQRVAVNATVPGTILKSELATRVIAPARVIEIRFTHTSAAKAYEVAQAVADEAIRTSEARRKEAAAQLVAEAGDRQEDARSWAAFRGEKLRMLDAGVVPVQPSSPRVLLNVMSAMVLALALSGIGVMLSFALRDRA